MSADAKSPTTPTITRLAEPPLPKLALLVLCVECGAGVEAPLPIDPRSFTHLLAPLGWHASALSPPGTDPVVLGAVCVACAPQKFPPEIMKAAEERRQAVLATMRQEGLLP